MKLTIGKKITIGLVTAGLLASAFVATFFGVKAAKEKTSQNPGPSVTTPVQPDNPDIPDQPDKPDQPDQPDQPDHPVIEKTEQDYMNECDSKLKTAIESNITSTGGNSLTINSYAMNQLNGKIYANVTYKTKYGSELNKFMTFDSGLGDISSLTYEQVSKKMEGLQLTNRVASSVLQEAVSEELYNQLCDYVLDKVGLEGARILNATEFTSHRDGYYTNVTCMKDNKIYNVYANVNSFGSQEDHISKLMEEGRTKEIKITSEENFKEFVTESTAQASAQSNSVIYFDVTIPTFDNETNKETTKTFTVRQTNGKADYRGFSC